MQHTMARVAGVDAIARGIYLLRLHAPDLLAQGISPGQFVHIRLPGAGQQRLLRRPISVMAARPQEGVLDLAIQTVGPGTLALCGARPGDTLAVLGPLGRGFDAGQAQRIFFVGGGVGVAPIRFAMDAFAPGRRCAAFFGFRGAAFAYGIQQAPCPVQVTTDDGGLGARGQVSDLLRAAIEEEPPDLILACGPTPMLRTVQRLAVPEKIPCQLSLEEYMACGLGACLVCACKTRAMDGQGAYRRVCVDGPVFPAEEVCFDG
ncbi:MAG: dihydroorotate dehydrogenase electron transfer subunit [Oscillospiraceae bacterium]|jgi:dihydroorotate dehydrogenase electron transfer subunit|nr:dihydroorotate dehydrogenase electron transfer subunit [Oscillospiraceae bacterium]